MLTLSLLGRAATRLKLSPPPRRNVFAPSRVEVQRRLVASMAEAEKRKDIEYGGRMVSTKLGIVDLTLSGIFQMMWNSMHRIDLKVGANAKRGSRRRHFNFGSSRSTAAMDAKAKRRLVFATLRTASVITEGHRAVRRGNLVLDVYSARTGHTVRMRSGAGPEVIETVIPEPTTAVKRHARGEKYRPLNAPI